VGNLKEDMRHIKTRMTSMKENFISMTLQMGHSGQRLERIKGRPDLV